VAKKDTNQIDLGGLGGKLLGFFNKKKSGGKSGLTTKLLLLGVFAAILAVVTWQMARMGKKLAKLENEKERKKVEAENFKLKAQATEALEVRKVIEAQADLILAEAEDLEQEIEAVKAETQTMTDAISRAKTWKDIDSLIVFEDE